MSKCRDVLRLSLVTLTLTLLAAGGSAAAQPWNVSGSDTLETIMIDAIAAAKAAGAIANPGLVYVGGGSGTAETAMGNGTQSIGPMSRNFGSTVLAAHPTWAPGIRNVVALDAGVLVTKNTTARCKNVSLPLDAIDPTKAAANVNVDPFNFGTLGSGYSQLAEIILSGEDGSGSVAACASPRRIQAIQDFAACQGVPTVDHFYRRDDNSGTTDTFKEKLIIRRFCNGRARGVLGSNTTEPTNPNLNNQDLDPVRRPCPAPGTLPGGALRKRTTCTNLSTGLICAASDNPAGCEATGTCPCTQGVVVALSVGDNATDLVDVTTTIGSRVGADPTGQTFGFAGREAVRLAGAPTAGPFINTNSFSNAIVRLDAYMLSRRLFLQYGADITLADALRDADEEKLFNYMTGDGSGDPQNGAPGRCIVDPIVASKGFIPCLDDCLTAPSGSSNLCSKLPFPPAASSTTNCIPAGTGGSGTLWNYGTVACTAGSTCCSTGLACPASLVCPAVANLPVNSACSATSQCASPLTCSDAFGIGTSICN
jgi:hypothetical protein